MGRLCGVGWGWVFTLLIFLLGQLSLHLFDYTLELRRSNIISDTFTDWLIEKKMLFKLKRRDLRHPYMLTF